MSKKTKSIWDLNPTLKAYHQTSDGSKFSKPEHAKSHARSLKDKTVKTVHRPADKPLNEAPKSDPNKSSSENELTPMQKAQLRIDAINKLETVAEVEKALEGETAKTVKAAGEERIKALEAASKDA